MKPVISHKRRYYSLLLYKPYFRISHELFAHITLCSCLFSQINRKFHSLHFELVIKADKMEQILAYELPIYYCNLLRYAK